MSNEYGNALDRAREALHEAAHQAGTAAVEAGAAERPALAELWEARRRMIESALYITGQLPGIGSVLRDPSDRGRGQ